MCPFCFLFYFFVISLVAIIFQTIRYSLMMIGCSGFIIIIMIKLIGNITTTSKSTSIHSIQMYEFFLKHLNFEKNKFCNNRSIFNNFNLFYVCVVFILVSKLDICDWEWVSKKNEFFHLNKFFHNSVANKCYIQLYCSQNRGLDYCIYLEIWLLLFW